MTILYGYLFYLFAATIGISIGYHRYFTHLSFKSNKFFEIVMLMFGLICGGRSPLTWVAVHRYHHAHSDTEKDPHSPIYQGSSSVIFSQWNVKYIPKKFIKPLMKNKRLLFFHKYGMYMYAFYLLVLLLFGIHSFIIFGVIPFLLSWIGFGLLNYFAHKNGEPENVPLLNIIAPGEGWHRTHHDRPNDYKLHKYDIAGVIIELYISYSKFIKKRLL
jgi:fatty-acid desaturase